MTSLAKIIALALISIIGFYGAAQEIDSVKLKKFDSIKQEINTVRNAEEALVHFKKRLKYSKAYQIDTKIIESYWDLAGVYVELAKSDSAQFYYDNAIQLSRNLKDPFYFSASVVNSRNVELSIGNHDKVTKLVYEAMDMLKDSERDKRMKNNLLFTLADIYTDIQEYEKALANYNKILDLTKDPGLLPYVYSSIGRVYGSQQKLDSAIYYYKQGAEMFKANNVQRSYSSVLKSIGALYSRKEEYKAAEEYYLEAKAIQEKFKYNEYLGGTLLNLAGVSRHLKKFDRQLDYLLEAEKLLKDSKDVEMLEDLNFQMMTAYARKGDNKNEDKYLERYFSLKDSIFNDRKAKAIAEIETEYEVKEKDAEIARKTESIQQQKRINLIILIAAIIITILLAITLLLYKQKLKRERLLFDKQAELNDEKVSKIIEHHKLQNVKAHITGQNKERERISKDLHDGVCGTIAGIKMKLEKLVENQNNEIKGIIDSLEVTYDEVRSISHDLVPKNFQEQQFIELLKHVIEFSVKDEIKANYEFYPKDQLNTVPEDIQMNIYRIVQELLTNVNKHSEASEVFVNITLHENNVINIMVEDNGKGFTSLDQKEEAGIGLKSIRKRVAAFEGALTIDSNSKTGTSVSIDIPIEQKVRFKQYSYIN
ncbi:tetratricopeptide repeat-containing sensor histidine kinase [Aquimarina brevivitae]|uniref:histidine kinase n=1 Tax=Aquimarina brevivitae TaxID=323412 RepID=A0A4Q7P171_9FLAO|nr:sensor histidine kinase [Aquimarina brevivitae]RZS93444.1 signal transduction histidine kinase [Aquimarina brevivitae]